MKYAFIFLLTVVVGSVFYFVNYEKHEMKIPVVTHPMNAPPSIFSTLNGSSGKVRDPASVANEKSPSDDDYYIGRGSGTEIYKNLSPEDKASVMATLEVEITRDAEYVDYLREIGNEKRSAEEISEIEKRIEEKKNILDELKAGSQ